MPVPAGALQQRRDQYFFVVDTSRQAGMSEITLNRVQNRGIVSTLAHRELTLLPFEVIRAIGSEGAEALICARVTNYVRIRHLSLLMYDCI